MNKNKIATVHSIHNNNYNTFI